MTWRSNRSSLLTGFWPMNSLISSGDRSVVTGSTPAPPSVIVIILSALQLGQVTCAVTATGISEIGTMFAPSKLDPHL